MDLDKLYQILQETTVQLRKGEVFEGTPELVEQAKNGEGLKGGGILEVFAMPHESEAKPEIEKVDLCFLTIGVDKSKAEGRRAELIELLNTYPNPEQLASGPSYIAVGAEIGDQGAAFQLFALGKVLGLWDIITPKMLGAEGEQALQMAGAGYIMISGYKQKKKWQHSNGLTDQQPKENLCLTKAKYQTLKQPRNTAHGRIKICAKLP